jgi:hypothetical protein
MQDRNEDAQSVVTTRVYGRSLDTRPLNDPHTYSNLVPRQAQTQTPSAMDGIYDTIMAFALHQDGHLRALLTERLDLGTNEGSEIIDKRHLLKLALPPPLIDI